MERHSIRWSTATVEPVGGFYELHVELESPETSQRWVDAFNDEAARRHTELRGQPWGSVGVWGNRLVVQEVEHGSVDALRSYLAELFESVDPTVEARRLDHPARPRAQTDLEHRQVAAEMARSFRSG